MTGHTDHCSHEKDWGRVLSIVENQQKQLNGNGQPGIAQVVGEMSSKIEAMTTSINDLSTNVSALMKFQNEFIGAEKAKDKGMSKTVQVGMFLIAIIMALIGYANLNKQNKDLKWEVGMVKAGQATDRINTRAGAITDSLFYESITREN